MPIELANIQLHRVHRIRTLEQASLIHHPVPGLEGDVTQNLGRDSVRLEIEGIFYGPNAGDNLEILRNAYKKREPVDFLADAVGQAYFSQVVLERFEVAQSAEMPDQFSYRLTIAEYVSASKSPAARKAAVNQAIKQQAQNLMQVAALADALNVGLIPELSNPIEPLTGAIQRVEAVLSAIMEPKGPLNGLQILLTAQLDTPLATAQPSRFLPNTLSSRAAIAQSIPQPVALKQQPASESLKELLEAGVPVKDLLSAGVTVKDLLQARASLGAAATATEQEQTPEQYQMFLVALQQAGVTPEALLAAGVTQQALDRSRQILEALAWCN